MKPKKTEIPVHHPREVQSVRIVADAAVSTRGLHGGRLLPLLLLDTTGRPDIAELIRVHETFGTGDVKVQWGQVQGHEGTVALFLNFIRPLELFVVLEFDIVRQGILVEHALSGQGIYLARAEHEQDRIGNNLNRPKVIIDVLDTGFAETWNDLFHKHLAQDFRKKGLSRSDSLRAARSAIEELRRISNFRMRDIHD